VDDIEHLVRVTLTDRAAAVGAPAGLAHTVRGRARHARLRAQAAGAAVAAAAVLLAVPAAARLWSTEPESTVDVAAAPAADMVPPFPFTPTATLPGYGEPIAELSAGVPSLRHDGGPDRWLTVSVSAAHPSPVRWDAAPKTYSITVRDRKAVLEVGPTSSTLTWQAADGRWLRVEADRHLTRADLTRYAAGLVPGAVPVRWPFTFETVPPGTVPDVVSPAAVSFRPEASPPSHAFTGKLTVMLSETADVPPTGNQVTVGARTGWLTTTPEATTLSVALGDGRTLVIQSETSLSETDLVTFAAGTTPTPDAEVGHG